jgi:hypothetical protein
MRRRILFLGRSRFGAAGHLAFECFDVADVAFGRAAAVGQGEPLVTAAS